MPTDTKLNQLIINQLTQEQYDEAKAAGTLSDTELYITDSDDDPQVKSNLSQTIDDSTTKYPSNKAVKDESSRITTLMNTKISNCITEIPQDIKLELNNGTLTLKAGSKVYIPNGTGVFDVKNITSDLTTTETGNDKYILTIRSDGNLRKWQLMNCFSGSTAPTGVQYPLWYDTTNNLMKTSQNGGQTWSSGDSFPLCIFTVSSGAISSIDQVFNGFGYIGSTIFALPGVKGLIPNGRNADGSLKSIEITLDKVLTFDSFAINSFEPQMLLLDSALNIQGPTTIRTISYNETENYTTYNNTNQSWLPIINLIYNDNKITSFTPKTVFHALDYNDKSTISGWSMPSSRYIDLTLGASGSTYTAPANGWFSIAKRSGATNQYLGLTSNGLEVTVYYDSGMVARNFIPCKKGGTITVNYNMTGYTQFFRFIYAEGGMTDWDA